jgi:hypothetical protein
VTGAQATGEQATGAQASRLRLQSVAPPDQGKNAAGTGLSSANPNCTAANPFAL